MEKYILVVDAGSTNVKASLVDKKSCIFSSASSEFPIEYPGEGLVEESGTVIWGTTVEMIRRVITKSGIAEEQIDSIGITNHREAFLLWDKKTGMPVYNALGWQDKRGEEFSARLLAQGHFDNVYQKTGLFLANFMPSASKLKWILDNVEGVRERAEAGELQFGTFDTWLIWNLTGGKQHYTDVTNASRTMLFNLATLSWDAELLELFTVPPAILPEIMPSGAVFGQTCELFHRPIPICSALGDQHAATFGQRCFKPGMMKATYGSSCTIAVNIGNKPVIFPGLSTTVGWQIGNNITYIYESGFYSAGFALKWLRDVMQLVTDYETMNSIATSTKRCEGLYFCPTFFGITAPRISAAAKGVVTGLGIVNGPNDIIKAAVDALAYTTNDCVEMVRAALETPLNYIAVDGGVAASDYILQMVADITRLDVVRPSNMEATTVGAAYMGGIVSGFWENVQDIEQHLGVQEMVFKPKMRQEEAEKIYTGWQKVLVAALALAE